MTFPDATTRLAGVLGHPVAHSLSPAIHNAALRHAGVNAVYLAFDVPPADLSPVVAGLRALGAVGVNVTIPHKREALALADERGEDANLVGAANTLVFSGGSVVARNTDVGGVARTLEDLRLAPRGGRCLLLGAGGAGRAAAWALARAGAAEVAIANRTASTASDLASALADAGHAARTAPWASIVDEAARCDVLVNATSVGMGGEESPLTRSELARAAAGGCRGLLDLVYGREETALVREARRAGLIAADGLATLVHQAAEAYEMLFEGPAPIEVMAQAAHRAAGREVPRPPGEEESPPLV